MRRRTRGFTLIELMVALAVAAILAAISLPSFWDAIRKSRRSEAKNGLLDLAARQERYFTTNNAYAATPSALGYGIAAFPVEVRYGSRAHYRMNMTVAAGGAAWTAVATPVGAQADDACGSYTLNSVGAEGNTGSRVDSGQCW